eukprot:TRINITY_DN8285_c0_g1_i3.p1 TRINITY_DN8285_c0_g1~~TRINITY_DN8285_c0_g1_i3.p1  ORF type:complete len:246 (-),score=16.23 TRINITY_DN8285_c0_g1_i3:73-810(-)
MDSRSTYKHIDDSVITERSKMLMAVAFLVWAVCIYELILASLWYHIAGIVISSCLCLIFTLFNLGYGLNNHRLVLWYSSKVVRILFYIFCFGVTFLLVLFILVHLLALDPKPHQFPTKCKKVTNCIRLTTDNKTNVDVHGLKIPVLNDNKDEVYATTETFFADYPGTQPLSQHNLGNNILLHFRTITSFFGFADDSYVLIIPSDTTTSVWIQGESRLGTSDFGVNRARMVEYLDYLKTHHNVTYI